ncbi:RNA polymerase II transcriptional coactivator KIWI family protein [Salix suchowensis]|nr:RNA polymerase II transcriptional coactivator KIWI family protein [Salix suchowensis]
MSGRGGKRAAAAREEEEGGADDNFAQQQPPAKKYAKPDNSSSDNSDDIVVCEIGRNRRVTVRNWRGKINVDIREFYPKDGNLLPGKKGITLSMEQWNMLRDNAEEIDKALGHS